MSEAAEATDAKPGRHRGKPLLLAGVASVLLGAAGFWLAYSGTIPLPGAAGHAGADKGSADDIAFVAIEPLVVSLGEAAASQHLRFAAQLEVPAAQAAEVAHLQPRILDVLNGYLRAVEVERLEDPAALILLRAQMLRRIQIVTGEGRVRDLLVTEFVLN
jgi:flagellar FliL protein